MKIKGHKTIYVNNEAFDGCSLWFRAKGLTISGYINAMLLELYSGIQGESEMIRQFGKKEVEQLTLKEFGELTKYWMSKMKE